MEHGTPAAIAETPSLLNGLPLLPLKTNQYMVKKMLKNASAIGTTSKTADKSRGFVEAKKSNNAPYIVLRSVILVVFVWLFT